ncbi:MAG: diacylglycerol kinase [Cyanobacteriota bacterium]
MKTPYPAAFPPSNQIFSRAPRPRPPQRRQAWQVAPDLLTSFRYAWAGVRYAFVTQRNFRIHTCVGSLAIVSGILLQVTGASLAILTLTSALVMILELLNTALESVVDLTVGQSYHELAKIAKDCAAGAVLLSALAAVIVGGCLLLPALLAI